jgi:hypothetical protein
MATTIEIKPAEEASAVVSISAFYDASTPPVAVTPLTITWTLTDRRGTVINSRTAVAVTPAASVAFLLSGDDLAVTTATSTERHLLITWTYNSTLGNGLVGRAVAIFEVEQLAGVN